MGNTELTKIENPQAEIFESPVFGPPLGTHVLFTFERTTRIVWTNARVTKPTAGILFQSISLHNSAGAILYSAALAPILNAAAIFGTALVSANAGPEQIRVPFFQPNVLFATWPKDCYGQRGGFMQFNNLLGAGDETAVVRVGLVEDDGYRN